MPELQHGVKSIQQSNAILPILSSRPYVVADKSLNLLPDVVHILDHILGRFPAISHLLKLHLHQARDAGKFNERVKMLANERFKRLAFNRRFGFNSSRNSPLIVQDTLAYLIIGESPQVSDTRTEIRVLRILGEFISDGRKFPTQNKFRLLIVEPAFIENTEFVALGGKVY